MSETPSWIAFVAGFAAALVTLALVLRRWFTGRAPRFRGAGALLWLLGLAAALPLAVFAIGFGAVSGADVGPSPLLGAAAGVWLVFTLTEGLLVALLGLALLKR